MSRRRTASILATTMLGTMDSNALVPVVALYAASLGAALSQIGIIVGLYSAVHAPANILFGRIADRWGRVRPLRSDCCVTRAGWSSTRSRGIR